MKWRKTVFAIVLASVVLLSQAGCGTGGEKIVSSGNDASSSGAVSSKSASSSTKEESVSQAREKATFTFYMGTGLSSIVLDQDGNEVPEDKQYTILYDLITKEPQCKQNIKIVESDVKTKDGVPMTKRLCALFDMEGNMIYDYSESSYIGGFGDFIIKHDITNGFEFSPEDDFNEELINFKTGETVLTGVGNLKVLDAKKGTFMACDMGSYELLGVIDKNAKVISGFPTKQKYYYPDANDTRIVAKLGNYEKDNKPESILLSEQLEPIMTASSISYLWNSPKGYLVVTDGEERYIIDENSERCFDCPLGMNLQFFNGKLAVMNERIDGEWRYSLLKVGEAPNTTEAYKSIIPAIDYPDENEAKHIIGVNDNKVDIFDSDGKIVKSKEFEGSVALSGVTYLFDDYISIWFENGFEGLYDLQLNELIKPDKYYSINAVQSLENDKYVTAKNLIRCNFYVNPERRFQPRSDLLSVLDLSKPVGTGFTSVTFASSEVIAVKKGFSFGLIDYQGNWVSRHSLFNDFRAEDSGTGAY